jgi:hypothetical protein
MSLAEPRGKYEPEAEVPEAIARTPPGGKGTPEAGGVVGPAIAPDDADALIHYLDDTAI